MEPNGYIKDLARVVSSRYPNISSSQYDNTDNSNTDGSSGTSTNDGYGKRRSNAAVAARTTITTEAATTVRQAGKEAFNPIAVKDAAETTAQRAVARGESSLLSGLTHARPETPTTVTSSTSTVTNTVLSEMGVETASSSSTSAIKMTSESTIVGQALQQDLGVTIRETMTNAGETGLQQLSVQAAEAGEAMLEGKFAEGKAMVAMTGRSDQARG